MSLWWNKRDWLIDWLPLRQSLSRQVYRIVASDISALSQVISKIMYYHISFVSLCVGALVCFGYIFGSDVCAKVIICIYCNVMIWFLMRSWMTIQKRGINSVQKYFVNFQSWIYWYLISFWAALEFISHRKRQVDLSIDMLIVTFPKT